MVLADKKDWSQEESYGDGDGDEGENEDGDESEDRGEDEHGDGREDGTLQKTIADLTSPPPSPPPRSPPLRPVPFVPPTQPLSAQNSHPETPEKGIASGGDEDVPSLGDLAFSSARTRLETASPIAWRARADSSAGMTKASSASDAGRSVGLEEGEIDEHRTAQGNEVHPQSPVQRPRTADPNYSPIHRHSSLIKAMKRNRTQDSISASTDQDEFESVLQSTLEDLTHLSVPPSQLTIMPSTEIGSGKYGEVLLAVLDRGSQIPTPVAVKELRNVGTRGVRGRVALRLARELKIWARLNHPNILPLIGYYLSENYETARFISPLMANGNVSQYLERAQVDVLKRLDIVGLPPYTIPQ
ncbi:hypothetical protein FRC00_013062 [Tulasnella sp. 408]|nr:hypothetical protein FRC00_013062 [Tulasnella sp. 408]